MKRRPRIHYTQTQRALMWNRWQQGDSMHDIARLFDRSHPAIHRILTLNGGFRPREKRRSPLALTLAEREVISRGLASQLSMRTIAAQLERSPSTVSWEIQRNGGYASYRASAAETAAWQRALRPKACKLAGRPQLVDVITDELQQQWMKAHPTDVDVRLYLANELALENDMEAAEARYLEVLKQHPGNITALNNMAWNVRFRDPKRALALIHSAIKIAPDSSPQLFDTLAVIESINGDYKSAQKSIQRARAELPDDYTVRYHEAMIAAKLVDKAQAIAALDELLKNDSGLFPERAEAEVLLKALKEDVQSLSSPG